MYHKLTVPISQEAITGLHVGDQVYLSGVIVTARDAAHKLMIENFIPDAHGREEHPHGGSPGPALTDDDVSPVLPDDLPDHLKGQSLFLGCDGKVVVR